MKLDSVIKNSSYLVVGQVVSKGISMISVIWLARYITVENYGFLNYVLSFWAIVMNFVEGGTGALSIRETARQPSLLSHYITATFALKSIVSLISLPIVFFTAVQLHLIDDFNRLWVFIALGVCQYVMQIIMYSLVVFFRAKEAFGLEAMVSFLTSVIGTGLLIAAFVLQLSFYHIVWVIFISNLLSTFITLFFFLKFIGPIRLVWSASFFKDYCRASLTFAMTFIVGGVALKIAVPMLGYFEGDVSVGIYSASMRIFEGLMFVPSAVIITMYPTFSRAHTEQSGDHNLNLKFFIKLITLTGLPLILFSFFLNTEIISLLYGTKYSETAVIWPWWTIWFFIWSAKTLFSMFILAIDKSKVALWINVMGFFFTFTLLWILIPKYQYLGGTLATVVAESLMLAYASYYVWKQGHALISLDEVYKILGLNAVLFCVMLIPTDHKLLLAVLGGSLYSVAVFRAKIVSVEERGAILNLFLKLRKKLGWR